VICGRGKNGGAGLVAAEALHRVAETVSVIMLAKRVDELPPEVAACLFADIDPVWIADEADFANAAAQHALGADLIVYAMIGTGFKPPLRSVVAAVAAVNDVPGTVVSVDVPAGVDADGKTPLPATGGNVVFPHGVIALIAPKPVHVFGHLTAGPIAVSELGVQPAFVPSAAEINVLTGREVGMALAPVPDERTERPFGGFGHLLVVAGSPGQEGTAALVGMAALNAGAGRVTIACPKSIQRTVASCHAALSTQALPESDQGTIAAAASDRISALLAGKDDRQRCDAVAIGELSGSPRSRRQRAAFRVIVASHAATRDRTSRTSKRMGYRGGSAKCPSRSGRRPDAPDVG
jgi:ADP-dependent NAD(P)H-hydrate dehydratase / NAD(P)H-hydrate epimerase